MKQSQQKLAAHIHEYGHHAVESRQVARRLADLLPLRFEDIRRGLMGELTGAAADRMALADERYQAAIEEYCNVAHKSLSERIQYETHVMLYKARQSLRSPR